jgi:hypothetical protein
MSVVHHRECGVRKMIVVDEERDHADVVHPWRGERPCVAHQTRQAWSPGIVDAFDVMRETASIRESVVLGWWPHAQPSARWMLLGHVRQSGSTALRRPVTIGETTIALTRDPRRCAVMAMDVQHEILRMTSQYREKDLLGTVARVLDAARRAGTTTMYITVSWRDDYADAPAHAPLF